MADEVTCRRIVSQMRSALEHRLSAIQLGLVKPDGSCGCNRCDPEWCNAPDRPWNRKAQTT